MSAQSVPSTAGLVDLAHLRGLRVVRKDPLEHPLLQELRHWKGHEVQAVLQVRGRLKVDQAVDREAKTRPGASPSEPAVG